LPPAAPRRRLGGAAAELLGGLTVLPFLTAPPRWAVGYEGVGYGAQAPRSLPVRTAAQRAGWREFLRLAVFRYGSAGSFWAENPLLPARPIRIWQIWNEPNFKYFAARPNPAQYGKLVVQSYADLRSADPGARIVLGGLFIRPKGGDGRPKPGVIKRAYFATDEEVRAVLKRERDPGRSIWLHRRPRQLQLLRRLRPLRPGLRRQARLGRLPAARPLSAPAARRAYTPVSLHRERQAGSGSRRE
jgi:hypothetical protein